LNEAVTLSSSESAVSAVGQDTNYAEIFTLLGYYEVLIVVSYQRFGTTYRSHLQESNSPKKMPEIVGRALYGKWRRQ